MQKYWNSLQDAIAKTASAGFGTEDFPHIPHRIINEEHAAPLIEVMHKDLGAGSLTPHDIAFRCAEISWRMKRQFEEIVNTKVLLTLGGLRIEGISNLSASTSNLVELRKSGDYHVWWSLPSGEITDVTLATSMLILQGRDLSKAQPLAGFTTQFPQIEWVPKLVGDDVIRQLLTYGH